MFTSATLWPCYENVKFVFAAAIRVSSFPIPRFLEWERCSPVYCVNKHPKIPAAYLWCIRRSHSIQSFSLAQPTCNSKTKKGSKNKRELLYYSRSCIFTLSRRFRFSIQRHVQYLPPFNIDTFTWVELYSNRK